MNTDANRFPWVLPFLIALFISGGAAAQEEIGPAELDRGFAALYDYDTGGDRATLDFITAYVDRATGRYKIRVDAEKRLLAILESKQSSPTAKQFAADQLYRLCDEDTVPAFRNLLLRSDTSHLARKGLELIDHPSAEEALIEMLDQSSGSVLKGIIESLGNKADPAGVNILRRTAKAGNRGICIAALEALGKIPGAESMYALQWCRRNLTRPMRPYAVEAYLSCGWLSLEMGDYETAADIFDSLTIEVEPIDIRVQGLRGLIRAERGQSIPTIIEALSSDEPALQAVAAEESGRVKGAEATQAFIQYFPDVTTENQIILLRAFAKRGDDAVLPTVLLAIRSRLPEIRRAAIRSAGSFNHPDTLQPLLKAAGGTDEEEQRLAREALANLSGTRLNDAFVKAAMSADNAVRFEAIKTIAVRKTSNAIPVLLRVAERDVTEIRLEALKALGAVGTTEELPFMVKMHLGKWDDESRKAIAQAIVYVALRSPPGKARTASVGSALSKSSLSDNVSLSLVSILGAIQDDTGLSALGSHARKAGRESHAAALKLLADWPNDRPLDTLQRIASSAKDPAQRSVAFEGYLRQIQLASVDRDADRTARYYQTASKIAKTPSEKRAVIEALATFEHPESLKVLEKFLDDPDVSEDAGRAKESLAQGI